MAEQLELCDVPTKTGGPRPKIDDPDVIFEAAKIALPMVEAWHVESWRCGDGRKMPDHERWLEDITYAMKNYGDGYRRCRLLEMYRGWNPDSDLVNIFESDAEDQAFDAMVLRWAKNADVHMPPQGSSVKFTTIWGFGEMHGTVVDSTTERLVDRKICMVQAPGINPKEGFEVNAEDIKVRTKRSTWYEWVKYKPGVVPA